MSALIHPEDTADVASAAGSTRAAPAEAVALNDSESARRLTATLRITLGLVFVWAFADKTLGLGWSTPGERAWINGGSPTAGFLGHVEVGPLSGAFAVLAGLAVVDWLFMIGLLGIGLALVLGIGLRASAAATTVMMLAMWAAEWPPATATVGGEPSGSVNPLVDYHLVYALVAIALALLGAGTTWGLGRTWAQLDVVKRHAWLV